MAGWLPEGRALEGWALLFFACSFGGWLWENALAALQWGHGRGRGFLRGPLLPIYGLGALVVLAGTRPVRGNPAGVFWLGMGLAVLLEYLSGAALERLLGKRYWDYTGWPFSLNGYVCLPAALFWGLLSVGLAVLGPPLAGWLAELPGRRAVLAALLAAFTADLAASLADALAEHRKNRPHKEGPGGV